MARPEGLARFELDVLEAPRAEHARNLEYRRHVGLRVPFQEGLAVGALDVDRDMKNGCPGELWVVLAGCGEFPVDGTLEAHASREGIRNRVVVRRIGIGLEGGRAVELIDGQVLRIVSRSFVVAQLDEASDGDEAGQGEVLCHVLFTPAIKGLLDLGFDARADVKQRARIRSGGVGHGVAHRRLQAGRHSD